MDLGRPYPPALDDVIRHAQRLREYLSRREETTYPFHPGGAWLTGRAGEVQCVVALVAVDWYAARVSTDAAIVRLNRYLREMHDGLAMHLDVGRPPCCSTRPRAASPAALPRA
jgi:hypothetical protein